MVDPGSCDTKVGFDSHCMNRSNVCLGLDKSLCQLDKCRSQDHHENMDEFCVDGSSRSVY